MLLPNLDQINETYLQGLCDDHTTESQTLEFKLELPASDDKRELQKDLCALANADGGDIVYGLAEAAGTASRVIPLTAKALDAARRRVAQALDSLEPRLQGARLHAVPVTSGFVLIVRVPASFDGPHSYRVDSGARKFVMRNGTDTTDMNFDQIRNAFDRTAALAERARDFMDTRFFSIAQRKTWRPFADGPICIAAMVPIAGLAGRHSVDVAALNNDYKGFTFQDWTSVDRTMNLDGLVVYQRTGKGPALAYTQVYRNGAVIALRTGAAQVLQQHVIPSTVVTTFYRAAVVKAIQGVKALGFTGPAVLRCAMVNVSAYQFGVGQTNYSWAPAVAETDRDSLVLPDTWVNSIDAVETPDQFDDLVRPMMNVLWQAFDLERCLEFDVSGKWAPR